MLPLKVSIPKALIVTEKFCLPTPIVMRGTFAATLVTSAVTSIARTGSVATVTFTAAHPYQDGQNVKFAGAAEDEYNGWKQITYVSPTVVTFSIESTATTPATGTITGTQDKMEATGIGTFAGTDFVDGDWFYIPSQNALRQVANVTIGRPLHWSFITPFPSNVSAGELIRKAPTAVYKGVSVKNTGDSDGTYKEAVLANTDLAESNFDQACLAPVCGDATDTIFKINFHISKATKEKYLPLSKTECVESIPFLG